METVSYTPFYYYHPSLRYQTTPYLSTGEYEILQQIKIQYPKSSYDSLYTKILHSLPRMKNFLPEEIKKMYEDKRNELMFNNNSFEFFKSAEGITELVKMAHSPANYLWDNPFPFSNTRKKVQWSDEENQLLEKIMNEASSSVEFAFLPLCFPGRTGKQIHFHFTEMLKKNQLLKDPRKIIPSKPFDLQMHRYFIHLTEKIMTNELIDLFHKGYQITEKMIIDKANMFFRFSWVLSERLCYQIFMSDGTPIYKTNAEKEYSEEFISACQQKEIEIKQLLFDSNGNIDDDLLHKFLKKHRLPMPTFSKQWVRSFMKRNGLSWRHAHFSRYGAVDPRYVKEYKIKLAQAINRYGYDYVYNMDETAVRVVNNATRTAAPIGVEQVLIHSDAKEKEAFTAIGTCSRNRTYPLILLAKGFTEKCCEKFKARGATEVWPTKTTKAWMNEHIMLRYLQHLHDKIANKEPCALVLDSFKAHCTKEVIEEAKRLDIELIYVPTNGTGEFQPLDRRIFGILKSKLRSMAGTRLFSGPKRFEMIFKDLIKSWDEIEPENLISAWDIQDLEILVQTIANKGQMDENIFDYPLDPFDWESDSDSDDDDDDDPDYKGKSDF